MQNIKLKIGLVWRVTAICSKSFEFDFSISFQFHCYPVPRLLHMLKRIATVFNNVESHHCLHCSAQRLSFGYPQQLHVPVDLIHGPLQALELLTLLSAVLPFDELCSRLSESTLAQVRDLHGHAHVDFPEISKRASCTEDSILDCVSDA